MSASANTQQWFLLSLKTFYSLIVMWSSKLKFPMKCAISFLFQGFRPANALYLLKKYKKCASRERRVDKIFVSRELWTLQIISHNLFAVDSPIIGYFQHLLYIFNSLWPLCSHCRRLIIIQLTTIADNIHCSLVKASTAERRKRREKLLT